MATTTKRTVLPPAPRMRPAARPRRNYHPSIRSAVALTTRQYEGR